jgi:membrane associated rhomboid family serine protease
MSTPATRAPRDAQRDGLALLIGMAALMWVVEIVDAVAFDLDSHGIQPRDVDGLPGIAFAPFLHAGFGHLIGNTLPFLLLGAAIALAGAARVAAVTAIVVVVGGVGTWIVGPENTVHIGASGVVFGYASYLMSRAFWTHRLVDVGLGLLVLGVYGTTLLFGLVPTPGVSWQGHLFGAIGGVVAARFVHVRKREAASAAARTP